MSRFGLRDACGFLSGRRRNHSSRQPKPQAGRRRDRRFEFGDELEGRTLLNGSLDVTFDGDGKRSIALNRGDTNIDIAQDVAIQPDGKIVVVGTAARNPGDTDFAVVRLLANGQLDSTFGTEGVQIIPFNFGGPGLNNDAANCVSLLADGSILIGGSAQSFAGDVNFAVAKLQPNGQIDNNFGSSGRTVIGGTPNEAVTGMAVQANGRIVLVGPIGAGLFSFGDNDFLIARLTANGQLDGSFNGGGGRIISFAGGASDDEPMDVAIQPDGRIVVVGYTNPFGANYDFTAVRLMPSGAFDLNFGVNGISTVLIDNGGDLRDLAFSVALQTDAKILIGGQTAINNNGNSDFAVVRLNTNGSLDGTFNGNGIQTVPFNRGGTNFDAAYEVLAQPDGKIVLVGGSQRNATIDADFALARLNTDGSRDTTFGNFGAGRSVINFDRAGNDFDIANAAALQADGNIVAAGFDFDATGDSDFAIVRVLGNPPPPPPSAGVINLSAPTFTVNENAGSLTIPVSRDNGSSGAVSVTFTITPGTATAADLGGALTGVINFAAGQTTQNLVIPINDDAVAEGTESFTVTLSAPTGGASLGNTTVAAAAINDNDVQLMPGVISIGTSTFSVVENAGALSVPLVRQNGTDGSVSITFTIIPGTATAADIAGPMTGIITFANGQATQNLIIPIVDDAVFEGGETFSILISSPTNGATTGGVTLASVTLIENDSQPQPGSITLSAGAFAIAENAGSLTVPVLRQNGSDGAVSVTFMILAGTATTMDFGGALTGTINFAAGQTTQNLVIPLLDDAVVEGNETFTIIIVSPSGGATLGATPAATVTINENDLPPPPPPPPAAQPTGIQVVRNNRQGLTGLRVTFNNAINAADAASAFNYQFRRAGRDKRFGTRDDQRLAVRSATFDPNTKSLLITVQPLKAREQIQFTLLAANLRDANNQSVDGDRNGTPGGNFVANFRS